MTTTPTLKKPPLGLRPLNIHKALRIQEIEEAITRYTDEGVAIPKEWLFELNELKPSLKPSLGGWSSSQAIHEEVVETIQQVRNELDPVKRHLKCLKLLEAATATLELPDARFRSFVMVMATVAQDPTACRSTNPKAKVPDVDIP